MSADPDQAPMTAAERNALLKLIARQARVAEADVRSLAADRLAAFERQATELWDAQKAGVADLVDELNAELAPKIAEIRQRIDDRCDELGVGPEMRPFVFGGQAAISQRSRAFYSGNRQEELRRLAKAEIDAGVKRAKVEIERRRCDIEVQVISTGITSAEGRAVLDSLPKAEALLPPLDVYEIESRRQAGS